MTEEQIRKVFKLVEPFLPTKAIEGFNEFLEDHIQLKEMNQYNNSFIELQRGTIENLGKKLGGVEQKENELIIQRDKLKEENDLLINKQYTSQKIHGEMRKNILFLEKQLESLQIQINLEAEKNYQFVESTERLADERRRLIDTYNQLLEQYQLLIQKNEQQEVSIKELKSKEQELTGQFETLKEENALLLLELEHMKNEMKYQYDNGYAAALYQVRRKR